jgi:hypothetical protein
MSVELEDRLRDAFAHRAARTVVDPSSARAEALDRDAVVLEMAPTGRPGRRSGSERHGRGRTGRRLALVGAAAAMVVGAMALVQRIQTPLDEASPPQSVPVEPVPAADPRLALSLDDRRVLPVDESGVLADRYVLDPASVPEGWTVDEDGMSLLDPTGVAEGQSVEYLYRATLTGPDGVRVTMFIRRGPGDGVGTGEAVGMIDGATARRSDGGGTAVTWRPDPDITAVVEGTSSIAELVSFADALAYRRVGTFRSSGPDVAAEDARLTNQANVQFAGTLSGRPWAVEVDPGPLRTMWTSLDGRWSGGSEHDRRSQPNDARVVSVFNNLDATPGVGVVVYGYGPPTLTSVVATLADGSTVSFPTYQRELEAYFAVPIPVGVRVTTLSYLAGDEVRFVVDVPEFPSDLGGGYGGLPLP